MAVRKCSEWPNSWRHYLSCLFRSNYAILLPACPSEIPLERVKEIEALSHSKDNLVSFPELAMLIEARCSSEHRVNGKCIMVGIPPNKVALHGFKVVQDGRAVLKRRFVQGWLRHAYALVIAVCRVVN